jgi:hypothetical protein
MAIRLLGKAGFAHLRQDSNSRRKTRPRCTELRALTGNSTAGRDGLGRSTTKVTEQHDESRLPEVAMGALKLLETKVKVDN